MCVCLCFPDCMQIDLVKKLASCYEAIWQECLAEVDKCKVHTGLLVGTTAILVVNITVNTTCLGHHIVL